MSRYLYIVIEYEYELFFGFYSGYLYIKEIWIVMNIYGGIWIYWLDRR